MTPKPAAKPNLAVKPSLTLMQQFEKWSLPVVFVAIGGVIAWAIWHAYYYPSR